MVLAGLLLLAGVIIYGPMVVAPRARGGDMVGVVFVGIPAGTTAALLASSGLARLVLWVRRRATQG